MSAFFNENSFTLVYFVYLSILFLISCVFIRCDFSNINKVIFWVMSFHYFLKKKIEKKLQCFFQKAFVLFQQRIFTFVKSKIKKKKKTNNNSTYIYIILFLFLFFTLIHHINPLLTKILTY